MTSDIVKKRLKKCLFNFILHCTAHHKSRYASKIRDKSFLKEYSWFFLLLLKGIYCIIIKRCILTDKSLLLSLPVSSIQFSRLRHCFGLLDVKSLWSSFSVPSFNADSGRVFVDNWPES